MRLAGAALLASLVAFGLSGCDRMSAAPDDRPAEARDFPRADRPVAPIISTRWATEEARDRLHEADQVMNWAGVKPNMTVADIGAGEGYYTVRLAKRVGPHGRVLAEDILAEVIDALGRRVTRENWSNVSVKLGTPENPKLPEASFDRVFMVHMYHEIAEPYAFLWHLYPALKDKGEVIVLESDRPTDHHGTPPELLRCEFAAIGFVQIAIARRPQSGGYLARFVAGAGKPAEPSQIVPCRLRRPNKAKIAVPSKRDE
ncbi:MAG: methyltransferase domain-containing protein [Sphingobium sp.]|nr:methyltransferase domain-containing protein [Sphingobium sp.]